MAKLLTSAIVAASLGIIPALLAMQTAPVSNTPVSTPANAVNESLRIEPGDLIHVTVLREPELDQRVRVRDSGEISLPMIGAIQIRGLNSAAAAIAIAQRYRDGQFLKRPDVSVFVDEYGTQQVAILGQVTKPGSFALAAPRSLIDVLAMAGGLTEVADRHITVERADRSQAAEIFLSNNSDDAMEANAMIYPGDRILVPRAGVIYVLGDVGRAGGYIMQNESRMTVLQAIAMASGANRTASAAHVHLVRNRDGAFEEQEISLKEMERGEIPDMLLQPNDVLYVPFSFGRHIIMGSSSIVASASSALIYAGH
jgi:polysaccharide export outer membrane protein